MRALVCLILGLNLLGQDENALYRERVRAALRKIQVAAKVKEDLLYQRWLQKKELASDGQIKSQSVVVFRRDPWEEQIVTRVIEKDGKPLPAIEIEKQELRLQRAVEEARRNPPKRKDEETWLNELPDALDFRRAGIEARNGRPSEVLEFVPHPGYKAKEMRARAFEKIQGKVWIDQQEGEMAKLDVLVFDTVNVGFGMLGRIEKGTHFEMERKKWDFGMWFEDWNRVRFDVRVMLVKSLRQEIENRWSNLSPRPAVKPGHSGQ